jgi:hypothetical protein
MIRSDNGLPPSFVIAAWISVIALSKSPGVPHAIFAAPGPASQYFRNCGGIRVPAAIPVTSRHDRA